MPYVNIKITDEEVTSQQKAELIKGVTELLQKILNKNPETTVVVIDEELGDRWTTGNRTTEKAKLINGHLTLSKTSVQVNFFPS